MVEDVSSLCFVRGGHWSPKIEYARPKGIMLTQGLLVDWRDCRLVAAGQQPSPDAISFAASTATDMSENGITVRELTQLEVYAWAVRLASRSSRGWLPFRCSGNTCLCVRVANNDCAIVTWRPGNTYNGAMVPSITIEKKTYLGGVPPP